MKLIELKNLYSLGLGNNYRFLKLFTLTLYY